MNFLARLILGPFIKLAANVWCAWQDVKQRGEVADPPLVEDIPQRPCRINATPHRCDETDDEVIAAMEKQFVGVKVPRRFR